MPYVHHTLTPQHLADLGQVDVLLAAVDGSFTITHDDLVQVVHDIHPQLLIPMHYFSAFTLQRFLDRARQDWQVETNEVPSIVLSRGNLPKDPKVLVLPGN